MLIDSSEDVKKKDFFEITGITLLEGRYRLQQEVTGGKVQRVSSARMKLLGWRYSLSFVFSPVLAWKEQDSKSLQKPHHQELETHWIPHGHSEIQWHLDHTTIDHPTNDTECAVSHSLPRQQRRHTEPHVLRDEGEQ